MIADFSGRQNGNCDQIMQFISPIYSGSQMCFRDLNVHECSGCAYECFKSSCIYREDALFSFYEKMRDAKKIFFVIPMYCGNPCSLYYKFLERSQGYFSIYKDEYEKIISKLHIIGICGSVEETPYFAKQLGDFWFADESGQDRVLLLERRKYGQHLEDRLLDIGEVKRKIEAFVNGG